jgi:hypothetical protein
VKVTIQVVIDADDESPTVVRDVFSLERGDLAPDTVGLRLDEAKDLLSAVQEAVVDEQVNEALAAQTACPHCQTPRRHKDTRAIVVRSLYGTLHLPSPRWWHCTCRPQHTGTFSPIAALVPERTTPELSYLEAKFAGLAAYGLSAQLLAELLPLGRRLHATTVRRQAQAVAQRLENELADERSSFIDGCPAVWEGLPCPDLPLVVTLDGGYVHSSKQRSRRDGWFKVIAGRATPADGPTKSFGFVQTYDTKPKRRLFELLVSQGMQANQDVTFITDGGDDVRDLPQYLNPDSEHLLDWFHVTMRLTVMANMAKSLPAAPPDEEDLPPPADPATVVAEGLERLKWFCWHGNVVRALDTISDVETDAELAQPSLEKTKFLKVVREFDTYMRANAGSMPNYGERHRAGEVISSSMAESAVNQVVSKRMVKKQQMRWSPRGAHLLIQARTRVLNGDLADDFCRWYPGFTHKSEAMLDNQPVAA